MSMKHVPAFLPRWSLPALIGALRHHSAAYDACADAQKAAAAAGETRALDAATQRMIAHASAMAALMDDVLIYLSTIETPSDALRIERDATFGEGGEA